MFLPDNSLSVGPRGVIVIPARVASTRLPNKLLLAQTGRPLLAHVIDRAVEAARISRGRLTQVVVACDDRRLADIAWQCGVTPVLTRADHACGTTRIAEAITILKPSPCDFVVNVQGDEPELAPAAIVRVAEELIGDPTAEMATLVVDRAAGTEAEKADPSAVKAVLDARGRAIYFSRAAVPFDRQPPSEGEPLWRHHIGIYAYYREFLLTFARMAPSPLELREGLEQLRALYHGHVIRAGVVPAEWAGKGIDTPNDYLGFVRRHREAVAA